MLCALLACMSVVGETRRELETPPVVWVCHEMGCLWLSMDVSLNIFGFCIVNGCAGLGPGNTGKLILDLHFTLTTFFFTCSSFFQAAGEPFAVSFNILHRSDSA